MSIIVPATSAAPSAASTVDQLHRLLTARITGGIYRPGSRLDCGAVATEFGVSLELICDALARLELEQLVETNPRSDTFVARPTVKDVHELCQVRQGIEWVATGIAAETMSQAQIAQLRREVIDAQQRAQQGELELFRASDARLHLEIVACTGNQRMIDLRNSIESFVCWLRVLGPTGARAGGFTARHLQILEAMAARDVAAAQNAAAVHLDEVEAWTVADMEAQLLGT